uniref:Lon protease homolog, mitochondrial n=1 Tax=Panagrellus redivivus TaxID=6233 RepID=A0A7E4UVC6_PANRE
MASRRLLLSSLRSGTVPVQRHAAAAGSRLLLAKVGPVQGAPVVSVRQFSSNNSNNNNDDPINTITDETAVIETTTDAFGAPSTVTVPEMYPDVPVIAISRYPLFPGFIKKVDIFTDEKLKDLVRRRVKMRQPYVGVFVKKDDENKDESVRNISELYEVGSFAQILEMRDLGSVVELVLSAHRRIRLVEAIDDTAAEEEEATAPNVDKPNPISRLNGRRTGQQRKQEGRRRGKAAIVTESTEVPSDPAPTETLADLTKKIEEGTAPGAEATPPPPPTSKPEEKRVILARTVNISSGRVERTVEIKAQMQAIVQNIRDIVQFSPLFGQQINLLLHPSQNVIENPVYLCDLVATLVQSADTKDLQQMLGEEKITERLQHALLLLEKEKTVAKLKHEINKDVERKVQDQHRKYLLNEQLKAIKRELGLEKDDKQAVIEKMRERLKDLTVPEHVMKVVAEEEQKLNFLDPHSSEFSVARNYLDWLTNLPWGKQSEENFDLANAKKILDEDHYGMKDVKDRILEFIAVAILKQKVGGKILCFHGPPGVGKTSIARSIARALNREYFRFSVGGMTDVAEIKGHRRTYIGAMPGKMIQCLKKVQTENPLVLIDEVDKIGGGGYHGDPASALLELLDPEQNTNFNDHFLDVPVDLSKVLFISTANQLDTIPGPLRDRMELIEVSGYVAEEKLNIAETYLIPQCRENCALDDKHLEIEPEALQTLIKSYCRESGVRNLQKHIEKVFRKAAFQVAERKGTDEQDDKIVVSNDNLEKFVGRPKFTSDRMYEVTPPGVIMGLAWTSMGGSALYIEANLRRKFRARAEVVANPPVIPNADGHATPAPPPVPEGTLEATGHLGDVMKESMRTAYTVAKRILAARDPENEFLEQAHLHVHVPEGAVPKDGPSAGVTITSALLSLALNTPARQNIAMTGEISLTGKVLPVGGIKEKIIAAKRAGVNCVILPAENKKDIEDLPDFIKQDVEVHFATHYDDVFKIVFPEYQSSLNIN